MTRAGRANRPSSAAPHPSTRWRTTSSPCSTRPAVVARRRWSAARSAGRSRSTSRPGTRAARAPSSRSGPRPASRRNGARPSSSRRIGSSGRAWPRSPRTRSRAPTPKACAATANASAASAPVGWRTTRAATRRSTACWRGWRCGTEIAALRLPALFLAGRLDPLRPPEAVEPIARTVPGARFEPIESGHFSPTQTPEIVADRLNAFLAATGG